MFVIGFGIQRPQRSVIPPQACLFLVFSFIDFYFGLARHRLIHYSGEIWLRDHSLISCQQVPEQAGTSESLLFEESHRIQ